jgi:hypothetical protein
MTFLLIDMETIFESDLHSSHKVFHNKIIYNYLFVIKDVYSYMFLQNLNTLEKCLR